jgi:LPS sulfotransferase NodH
MTNPTCDNDIRLPVSDISRLSAKIPPADFINAHYDIDYNVPTENMVVIFSTPRSGSTMFCDILFRNKFCLAHEYIQHYQYMPILASRWNCIRDNALDKECFINKLLKYRTNENGWLGINIHGEHLGTFIKLKPFFPKIPTHYVHIIRRDTIAQAVSLEIALQTGQWSSQFSVLKAATYDFTNIQNRLNSIHKQNTLIQAYLKTLSAQYSPICYEELLTNPDYILGQLPFLERRKPMSLNVSIRRQSNSQNDEWAHKFSQHLIQNEHLSTGLLSHTFRKIFKRPP